MLHAVVREVSPALGRCELSYLPRTPIDVEIAGLQHKAYVAALARQGCRIIALPADPGLPDSVFVEDAAVVLPELAVITRPGAPSRRPETEAVAAGLASYRRLAFIRPPGTLDGGDVLALGHILFVGISKRSDADGIGQLRALAGPAGFEVRSVPVQGCLHLKSAATAVGDETLLLNPDWVDAAAFAGIERIAVDPREPHAANALRVGGGLIYPLSFPRTRARLESRGLEVAVVDVSELQKAEGAVTCCSLVFEAPLKP
ncbi:MAG: dimethylargininase [Candidatus Aminicenantes bacterium]|nr:dimethylargininase [Candidatus Aminicenantes bacterium]